MRKIVVYELLSLDGVAEAPEIFFGWDDALDAELVAVIGTQDAVILGRRTYTEWAQFWPSSEIEPFATFINRVTKYVATSTPLDQGWANATAVDGGLVEFVRDLKQHPRGDVGVDGCISVAQALLARNTASPGEYRGREGSMSILRQMGRRNYLIEGLSGTGKTSVCDELQRRGHHAIHGDRELAYRGDPETGEPKEGIAHEHHIWDVEKVSSLVADRSHAATFFCGGSRNFSKFIHLFDAVFVLEVDLPTLHQRLDERPDEEWGGGVPTEREHIVRWHQTKEDVPENGIVIDATAPIEHVVDEILRRCRASA